MDNIVSMVTYFNRRLGFIFTVIKLPKSFINEALKCKANLNLKFNSHAGIINCINLHARKYNSTDSAYFMYRVVTLLCFLAASQP